MEHQKTLDHLLVILPADNRVSYHLVEHPYLYTLKAHGSLSLSLSLLTFIAKIIVALNLIHT